MAQIGETLTLSCNEWLTKSGITDQAATGTDVSTEYSKKGCMGRTTRTQIVRVRCDGGGGVNTDVERNRAAFSHRGHRLVLDQLSHCFALIWPWQLTEKKVRR